MRQKTKLILILLTTAALFAAIESHVPFINGPDYWKWVWQRLDPAIVYPTVAVSLLPFLAAQIWFGLANRPIWPALVLLAISTFAMECTARAAEPNSIWSTQPNEFSLSVRISYLEQEYTITGYFTHAREHFVEAHETVPHFLSVYPSLMGTFKVHPRIKPPGPILYYLPFMRIWPDFNQSALIAGIVIGLLATLSVPATWWMIRDLTGHSDAAFHGASFIALCPSLVVFFPKFDQFFPVIAAAMIVFWARALRHNRYVYSILLGLVLWFMTFQTYNLLVLGAFMIAWAISWAAKQSTGAAKTILKHAAVSALTCIAIYVLLYAATRFDPIATFRTALANQRQILPTFHRPWPTTIPFDLLDFLLGMGWLGGWLIAFYVLGNPGSQPRSRDKKILVGLCIAQPILVALLGILQAETARVWAFMLPLAMVPIGLELTRWNWRGRLILYGCLGLLTAALIRNMIWM